MRSKNKLLNQLFLSAILILNVIQSVRLSSSEADGDERNIVPARGTIVYRRRVTSSASPLSSSSLSPSEGHFPSGGGVPQVITNARGLRQVVFSSPIPRHFYPAACNCMDYWECVANNGHVYSYCGISDSEVCCFYNSQKKQGLVRNYNNNNRGGGGGVVNINVNNNDGLIINSSSAETTTTTTDSPKSTTIITTLPTTTTAAAAASRVLSSTSGDDLLTTGNDFVRKSSTPPSAVTVTKPSLTTSLPDVDYFYSLENGNGDLKRVKVIPKEEKSANEGVVVKNNNGNGNEGLSNNGSKTNHPANECGRQVIDWKLDSQAEFWEWPWHLAILEVKEDLYVCGATLISRDRAITAAHCLYPYTGGKAPKLKIRAGEYDVSTNGEPEPYIEVDIERIIVHPRYNNVTLINDIALIKLKTPLKFSSNVRPICLPTAGDQQQINNAAPKSQKCVVAGWGRVTESSPFSVLLKEIVVPIWSRQQCEDQLRNNFGTSYKLPETAVCAGEAGHAACDGDGGGGLVCFNQEQSRWSLIGIVSFGIGCGVIDVYTNVYDFMKWITAFNYL